MRVFISYRRDDTLGHVGRLEADLRKRLGDGAVFKDMSSLQGGEAFEQRIASEVLQANVLLAMLGPRFLTLRGAKDARRIDEPDDLVRREIEMALAAKVRVIPVLVQGASMPRDADLPESIRALSKLNAVELSDSRWDFDVGRLCDSIAPRADLRPLWAGGALMLAVGAWATWHLTGISLPGAYRCESGGQVLPNCRIEKAAAGLVISFDGPNHGQGGLVDTFAGAVKARHCGFTAHLTNEFAASAGASERFVSELDLVCDGQMLRGEWSFGNARRKFEMRRAQ